MEHIIAWIVHDLIIGLKRATTAAVPSKVIKLKGHKFKASPTVLHLLKICKEKYQIFVDTGT
jgi:hypothetical protein